MLHQKFDATEVSPGRRAIELMEQAKFVGCRHIEAYLQTLELSCRQAAEIADGGDVYPAGVRDVAARLAELTAFKVQSIYSIMRSDRADQPHKLLKVVAPVPEPVDEAAWAMPYESSG